MTEVRLVCVSEEAAQQVINACDAAPRKGSNSARRDGKTVIISYVNKMWPYDIAEMAEELHLASDSDIAGVYACL